MILLLISIFFTLIGRFQCYDAYSSYKLLTTGSTASIACNNMKIYILRAVEECAEDTYSHTVESRLKCNDKSFCKLIYKTHCKNAAIKLYYSCKENLAEINKNRFNKIFSFATDVDEINAFCRDKSLINPLSLTFIGIDNKMEYYKIIEDRCLLKNKCTVALSEMVGSDVINFNDVFSQLIYNCDSEKNITTGKEVEETKPDWNSSPKIATTTHERINSHDNSIEKKPDPIFKIVKVKPTYVNGYYVDTKDARVDEPSTDEIIYFCYAVNNSDPCNDKKEDLQLSKVCKNYNCNFSIREC